MLSHGREDEGRRDGGGRGDGSRGDGPRVLEGHQAAGERGGPAGRAGDMAELVSAVVVITAKDMAEVLSVAAVVVAEVVSAAAVVMKEVASKVAEGKVYQLLLTLTHAVTTTKSKASPPVQIINYTRNTKLNLILIFVLFVIRCDYLIVLARRRPRTLSLVYPTSPRSRRSP